MQTHGYLRLLGGGSIVAGRPPYLWAHEPDSDWGPYGTPGEAGTLIPSASSGRVTSEDRREEKRLSVRTARAGRVLPNEFVAQRGPGDQLSHKKKDIHIDKEKPMRATRLLCVTVILALSMLSLFGSGALASNVDGSAQYEVILPATTDSSVDYSAIASVIADYFTQYYRSLEQLAITPELADYIADTDETHLYLCALQYGIDWRKEVGGDIGAIADTKVESVEIKYAAQYPAKPLAVRAYVKVAYRYVTDKTRTVAKMGDLWEIEIDNVDGAPKITSMNSEASDYGWTKDLVADNLRRHSVSESTVLDDTQASREGSAAYTKKNAIDEAYATMHTWMVTTHRDSLANLALATAPVEGLPEDEASYSGGGVSALSVTVPYSGSSAAIYGWFMGDVQYSGIFHNMNDLGQGDCTNFVSQCLWVGYGGPNGNGYLTPGAQAACALLVWQNFRQIGSSDPTPWWGASVYNPLPRYASNHWMRVDELYSHVQSTSKGPRGTHHNSGRTWYDPIGSTYAVRPGNVLQLDQTGLAPYYHSVMVKDSSTTLGHPEDIYVSQHSGNYSYRQLYDVIQSSGLNYVRMLRMLSGSFNN